VGRLESGSGAPNSPLDRRQRLGRGSENQELGVARADIDPEITATVSAGWKKTRNVGGTTKLANFSYSPRLALWIKQ
jgi:outer membrane protein TolC